MRVRVIAVAALAVFALSISVLARSDAKSPAAPMQTGWILPEDAATKKNPLPLDAKTLATGKSLYKSKCERCHGPGGLGGGPDADPDATDMDLTIAKRADRNPDGVVYYKILNGRKKPFKMPAFKDELTEQQIWAIVAHVQSIRKK